MYRLKDGDATVQYALIQRLKKCLNLCSTAVVRERKVLGTPLFYKFVKVSEYLPLAPYQRIAGYLCCAMYKYRLGRYESGFEGSDE